MFFTLQLLRYCDSSQCLFLLSSLNLKVSLDVGLERWRCLFGGLRPPGCHSRLCIIHSHLSQVSESHRYQTLYDFQGKKTLFSSGGENGNIQSQILLPPHFLNTVATNIYSRIYSAFIMIRILFSGPQ